METPLWGTCWFVIENLRGGQVELGHACIVVDNDKAEERMGDMDGILGGSAEDVGTPG